MRSTRRTLALAVGIVLASMLAAGALVANASGATIGPDQAFVGEVNGQFRSATIQMGCFGPVWPGELGHPMAGQTLDLLSPPPPISFGPPVRVGRTGATATSIVARIDQGDTVYASVPFTQYFSPQPIPTTALLPCSGDGVVKFAPRPRSGDARSGAVRVSFVGQP